VQYVRFKGFDKAGDIINEYKFSGNLCKELAKIDTFIETSIAQKRPIPVSVLREETFSKYPYWATRELLMNSIMHRDYQSNAPVQFYEYDDRIEVQNPGGLYGKVSVDNFPNVSDYRNPFIAEAMKTLGYVNRYSRGVFRVQKELVENGNGEATFDLSLRTAFKVIENSSSKYFEAGFGAESVEAASKSTSKSTSRTTSKTTPRTTSKTTPSITSRSNDIFKYIKKNPYITYKEFAELVGISEDGAKYHFQKMVKSGEIKREGSNRHGKWVIL
jgi:ATP-dependent DNA helicase RecG